RSMKKETGFSPGLRVVTEAERNKKRTVENVFNDSKFALFTKEVPSANKLSKVKLRQEKDVRSMEKFSPDEEARMWRFVLRELKRTVSVKQGRFWDRYRAETGSLRLASSLDHHYRNFMAPQLYHSLLDRDEMLELYRLVPVFITKEIVCFLSKKFNVSIELSSEKNVIVSWSAIDEVELQQGFSELAT
ncbi:unnamed protein product, partial [Caenorhabditis auriculariae]